MSEVTHEMLDEMMEDSGPDYGYTEDELAKCVKMGTERAETLARKIVLRKKVKGYKPDTLDEEFIRGTNRSHAYYYPGVAGVYRLDDDTRISGFKPAEARSLPVVMYKFGRWLDTQTQTIPHGGGQVLPALEIAAATYYTLSFLNSPFDVANKRTSRTVSNAALMRACEEVKVGVAIPPITVNQRYFTLAELGQTYQELGKLRMDPFMSSVLKVQESGEINPLELHFANIWLRNLRQRKDALSQLKLKPGKNMADDLLWNSTVARIGILEDFIEQHESFKAEPKLVPDFLSSSLYTVA